MDNSSRPWSDLPQAVIGLIINKLELFRQKVRALAVCKNWQHSKDYVSKPGLVPWVSSNRVVSLPNTPNQYSLISELVDPHSQQTYRPLKAINVTTCGGILELVATKQGWLLFCGHLRKKSLLLYNPFTCGVHLVGKETESFNMKATIKTDPSSRQCEVFMLSIWSGYLRINTYNSSGLTLTSEIIVEMSMDKLICSVVYMKGFVNCLFANGELYSYSLEGQAWTLVASEFPKLPKAAHRFERECWLLEINENLAMVTVGVINRVRRWVIYRFDWSEMSWVVETGLKNCGIYLSGNAAFSAPLTNGSDKKVEECRLYYLNQQQEIKCYLMSGAMWTEIQCEEYCGIRNPPTCNCSFIEPPYFV